LTADRATDYRDATVTRFRLFLSIATCCFLVGGRARALPSYIDPYGKIEAGIAFPVRSPQSDLFSAGFGGRGNVGVGFYGWLAVQLTVQTAVLPARANVMTNIPLSSDPAAPLGLGGGIRLQLPYRYSVSLWVDADFLYVRTGSLDRIGYSVGVGLHIPVGARRMVRIGPFVRLFQVIDTADAPHVDSSDAIMLIAGASLEVGSPQAGDRDGDGVPDEADKCPDQPGPASTAGCPDRDGDGIPDKEDKCPDQPGPLSTGGCPDRDKDGIPDAFDQCPDQAGPAATGGCPDRDGDGIPDKLDKCPNAAGPAKTGGCPDHDGDGIPDQEDKCPDQPGPASTGGCPDRDGDGIPDQEDKCPDQAGTKDNGGCPVVAPRVEVKEKEKRLALNEKIYFDTGSSHIQSRSYGILDELAKTLQERPALKIRIDGHTDNVPVEGGTNKQLSEWRAGAVKDYLVRKGVDAKRLKTKGYGETRPVASNDSEEGREKNRRVEFVITGGEK